jgi:hypothetical protein
VRRTLLQIISLIPIPLVVLMLLHTARKPEPLQLTGKSKAAGGGAAEAVLPAEVKPTWRLQGSPVRYDEKTLFDRIDGAAPVYLKAGFVYSLGADYKQEGAKDPVVIDAYDMGTPSRALGVYATERDMSYTFITVGDAGYLASGSLNFWRGRFYVKLAGYAQGEEMDRALTTLARGVAAALPAPAAADKALAPLKLLPSEGRVPSSDGYAHSPLGDVEGLAGACYAEYKEGEAAFKLFVVREASAEAAAARFEKARSYFQKDKAKLQEGSVGKLKALDVAGDGGTASFVLLGGALLGGSLDLPAAQLATAKARMEKALLEVKP